MTRISQLEFDTVGHIPVVPTILDVVCATTGMGFVAVAKVTAERWIACNVKDDIGFGLQPGGELKVETTICHEVRMSRESVFINHVATDERYCQHATPAMYGFQSYVSVPIVLPDGTFFGTLCAIDPKPREVDTPATVSMFKLFAELIAFHIDAHLRLAARTEELTDEREVADLRDQFIAVLGHDLRNPLASIDAGVRLLQRRPAEEKSTHIMQLMQQSVSRMSRLIDDVLDFARGRLGGGFALSRDRGEALAPALQQVIDEARSNAGSRQIKLDWRVTEAVNCDPRRIAQLLSNLLGNALQHGTADSPIIVQASTEDCAFILSVTNIGEPIPPAIQQKLFQPFVRGSVGASQQGLGLGLYIAAEIARAHGGTLDVSSDRACTCFTFRMALSPRDSK